MLIDFLATLAGPVELDPVELAAWFAWDVLELAAVTLGHGVAAATGATVGAVDATTVGDEGQAVDEGSRANWWRRKGAE